MDNTDFSSKQHDLMNEIAIDLKLATEAEYALSGFDPNETDDEFNSKVLELMREKQYHKIGIDRFIHEDPRDCILNRETFIRLEWLFWQKVRQSMQA